MTRSCPQWSMRWLRLRRFLILICCPLQRQQFGVCADHSLALAAYIKRMYFCMRAATRARRRCQCGKFCTLLPSATLGLENLSLSTGGIAPGCAVFRGRRPSQRNTARCTQNRSTQSPSPSNRNRSRSSISACFREQTPREFLDGTLSTQSSA